MRRIQKENACLIQIILFYQWDVNTYIYAQLLTGFIIIAVVKMVRSICSFPVIWNHCSDCCEASLPNYMWILRIEPCVYIKHDVMWHDERDWPRDVTWCWDHHSEMHLMIHTCFLHSMTQSATEQSQMSLSFIGSVINKQERGGEWCKNELLKA